MTIFGIRIKDNDDALDYLLTIDEKLKGDNIIYNPFIGQIKAFKSLEDIICIISIRPIYADFSYFGYIMLIGSYIFYFNYLIIIPAILICLSHFFWTRYFYYSVLMFMFHKKRLGQIVLISDTELLGEILKWDR